MPQIPRSPEEIEALRQSNLKRLAAGAPVFDGTRGRPLRQETNFTLNDVKQVLTDMNFGHEAATLGSMSDVRPQSLHSLYSVRSPYFLGPEPDFAPYLHADETRFASGAVPKRPSQDLLHAYYSRKYGVNFFDESTAPDESLSGVLKAFLEAGLGMTVRRFVERDLYDTHTSTGKPTQLSNYVVRKQRQLMRNAEIESCQKGIRRLVGARWGETQKLEFAARMKALQRDPGAVDFVQLSSDVGLALSLGSMTDLEYGGTVEGAKFRLKHSEDGGVSVQFAVGRISTWSLGREDFLSKFAELNRELAPYGLTLVQGEPEAGRISVRLQCSVGRNGLSADLIVQRIRDGATQLRELRSRLPSDVLPLSRDYDQTWQWGDPPHFDFSALVRNVRQTLGLPWNASLERGFDLGGGSSIRMNYDDDGNVSFEHFSISPPDAVIERLRAMVAQLNATQQESAGGGESSGWAVSKNDRGQVRIHCSWPDKSADADDIAYRINELRGMLDELGEQMPNPALPASDPDNTEKTA